MSKNLRTVLIFAHECAPFHRPESTIGAQRPAQFAKYLPEFGWRAIVLCCKHSERERGSLDDIPGHVAEALERANPNQSLIVPTSSLPYDGWLDRSWRAVCRERSAVSRLRTVCRRSLTLAKLPLGDYSQSWQPCASAAAELIARQEQIDVCIGEHTPDAGLFLARKFAQKHGVPWLADFRDSILQPYRPLARRLYRPVAKRLLRTASGTINVTPVWTQLDRELFGLPAWTIPNGFDPQEFPSPIGPPRSKRFTAAFMGNLTAFQRLEVFLEGLARFRVALGDDAYHDMRFYYRGGAHLQVRRMVQACGVADIADIEPYVERHMLLEELSRADVLVLPSIATYTPDQAPFFAKGFYPGKTFEFLGLRRPILCVPGDKGLLDELILETNTGFVLPTAEAVSRYLIEAHRRWSQGQLEPYQPNEQAVASYTRRNLTGRLAAILDEIAAGCHTTPQRVAR